MEMTDNNSRLRRKLASAVLGHCRWLAAAVLVACSGGPTDGTTKTTATLGSDSDAGTSICQIYVDPTRGSDGNAGTSMDQPLQTLEKARSVVATMTTGMTGDITVFLRGGTYALTQTFTLGPNDSGTNGHNVIYQAYPGELPVISGGQTITGFQPVAGSQTWSALFSAPTRQLYVNDVRAQRAGADENALPAGVTFESVSSPDGDFMLQGPLSGLDMASLEVVFTKDWRQHRCAATPIMGPGASTTYLRLSRPCFDWVQNDNIGYSGFSRRLEGAPFLVTQPGQWASDGQRIVYMPRAGEDMTTAVVVAPVIEKLLSANGVSNVQFKGLTFAYGTWLGANLAEGYVNLAQDWLVGRTGPGNVPGNVHLTNAQNVRFDGNIFKHLGGQGLTFDGACQGNFIVGNTIFDVSASGIRLGEALDFHTQADVDAAPKCQNNTIANNYVHHVGAEYQGSIGILGGALANTTVMNNEVAFLPYAGMAIGNGSNATLTYAASSTIANNRVHDVMRALKDGGNIYVAGPQPGSKMQGNWVYNDFNTTGSLYLDDNSSGWDVSWNVITQSNVADSIFVHTDMGAQGNTGTANYIDKQGCVSLGFLGWSCPNTKGTMDNGNSIGTYSFTAGAPPANVQVLMDNAGVQSASPRDAAALDFGGAYGYFNNGQLSPNPATGTASCPAGYNAQQVLGTNGLDWPVYFCSRPSQAGVDPLLDFGGMWGYVQGTLVKNPVANKQGCPDDSYTDQQVLGTYDVDWPLHVCSRSHTTGVAPAVKFGGMYGYINSGVPTPNPAIGENACPAGYADTQVLGSNNVDWGVHFCWSSTTSWDFGGAYGMVAGSWVPNPVTGATTCPNGYDTQQVLGTINVDYPAYVCSRRHVDGVDPAIDFGGMYGHGSYGTYYDPVTPPDSTGVAKCPAGYQDQQILGTYNVDWDLHVCYQPHAPGSPLVNGFGGAWGYVNGSFVPNPTTGGASCPFGYTAALALWTDNTDYPVGYCVRLGTDG